MLKISYKPSTSNKNPKNANLKAFSGALIGTVVPVAMMMKKQNIKNPLKLEYGLKNMVALSGMSILGGTSAGMINDDKKTKFNKFKEGVFQFLNATLPAFGAAGALEICKKNNINSAPSKVISLLAGIAVGMFAAVKVSNRIFNPEGKHPDRKLSPKDCLASMDDAIGALALAKIPVVQNLNLDKTLPLIYGYLGYRAGKAE